MGPYASRWESDGSPTLSNGGNEITFRVERSAETVMGVDVVGLQPDRFAVLLNRLIDLTLALQKNA